MKRLFQTFALVPALCLLAGRCAELPELVLPQGVGINIHFVRGHEKDLDLIAAAGIKFIRMDFGWAGIEQKKGEYNWNEYEELTRNLEKRGLRAIYILDYSNPLYEQTVASKNPLNGQEHHDTASPQHPESVAAYAKWAAAAAKHFAGRHIVWEIWNEPNISFWKPKPEAQQYITMCLAAVKAIRESDRSATIIAPATSEVPMPFLEAFCASGALEFIDAVSVHPYRNYKKGPETAAEDYAQLRSLIEKYAPSGKRNLPIVSGEWGYSTFTKGISVEKQGAFIVRQQLANLLNGIPISIWYDWKNDGENKEEREENFGIVTYQLKPKRAYVELQTMIEELNGLGIDHRIATGNEADFVVLFGKGNVRKIAAWTTREPHAVAFDGGGLHPAADAASDGRAVEFRDGKIQLQATDLPCYFEVRSK